MRQVRARRSDIEGLRAFAILAVVLYHADVRALAGGYVGVDVFFVVSGFLITRLLWQELERRGGISLSSFYGRRARRLLPASALVIVATVIASSVLLSPLEMQGVARDGVTSALYVSNYRFALQHLDYLSSTSTPSPLQHFWSLGVEEQFYLLWPALLLLASLVWRRSRRVSLPVATAVLIVLGAASFIASLRLTQLAEPWAFFSLPTRAWELAAGGLLALLAPQLGRLPRALGAVLGWTGLGVLAWAATQLTDAAAFPGLAALAPVGGTVAVLIAGCVASPLGPGVVLDRDPLQLLGKISYSWYLWHWPVLILARVAVGHQLSLWQNLALVGLSGQLALVTVSIVEDPVRFSRWLARHTRRSLALGASLTTAATLCSLAVADSVPALEGRGVAASAGMSVGHAARSVSADPTTSEISTASEPVLGAVAHSVGTKQVPANLDPPLESAHASKARPFVDGCFEDFTGTSVHSCVYGDTQSSRTVVLFGDSHATMWFPALDAWANNRGFRLLAFGKATCPPLAVPVWSPDLGRHYRECDKWRAGVLDRIRIERPSLVVLGVARHYGAEYRFGLPFGPEWVQGLTEMIGVIHQTGAGVVVIGPIPKPPGDVPNCLSAHLTDAVTCTRPLRDVVNTQGLAAERAGVVSAGGTYVDVTPLLCTTRTCAVIVGNLLVYRDENHLTTPYATWLAPAVGAHLERAAEVVGPG